MSETERRTVEATVVHRWDCPDCGEAYESDRPFGGDEECDDCGLKIVIPGKPAEAKASTRDDFADREASQRSHRWLPTFNGAGAPVVEMLTRDESTLTFDRAEFDPTPTTEDMREAWVTAWADQTLGATTDDLRAEFDRWLDAHDDLVRVTDSASEVFTTEGVTQWLSHPQHIGGMGGLTPREAIAQGKTDDVLRLLEGLKDGVVF